MNIQFAIAWVINMFAQAPPDLSGFQDVVFLFIALGGVALALVLSLAVIKAILDILGIDVLGIARMLKGGGD